MTTESLLLILGCIFFLFSLISKRIEKSFLTPPMLFVFSGSVLGFSLAEMQEISLSTGGLHLLAELTLVIVLAADASLISLPDLKRMKATPLRLLMIALPLIILLGTLMGKLVFPSMPWVQLALIAAILAPTDAALGSPIFQNNAIPLRIRQALNVESGLNDGIALPAVLFFACFLTMVHQTGEENWITFLALQLTLGPLTGLVVGWVGGHLIAFSAKKKWMTIHFQGVAALSLAVIAFIIAETIQGNGFIAAFVAGLTYGNLKVSYSKFLYEFTETESQFLTYLTFFLFGAVMIPDAIRYMDAATIIYAILSLTVVRAIPVIIALMGLKMKWPELIFMGWFGPRGLASILFALLILEGLDATQAAQIQSVVTITVLMSIVLHGLSSTPLSTLFGKWAAKQPSSLVENNPASAISDQTLPMK